MVDSRSDNVLQHPPNAGGLMINLIYLIICVFVIFSHDVLVAPPNDIVAKCIGYLTTHRKIFVTKGVSCKDHMDIWRYIVGYIARYCRMLAGGNIQDILG